MKQYPNCNSPRQFSIDVVHLMASHFDRQSKASHNHMLLGWENNFIFLVKGSKYFYIVSARICNRGSRRGTNNEEDVINNHQHNSSIILVINGHRNGKIHLVQILTLWHYLCIWRKHCGLLIKHFFKKNPVISQKSEYCYMHYITEPWVHYPWWAGFHLDDRPVSCVIHLLLHSYITYMQA